MKKNLLLVASLFFGAVAFAQECAPVTTLNEDFSTFTGNGSLPQKCWTGSHNYPNVYVDGTNDFATVYVSSLVDTPIYLVSPEVSTIDGNHKLSFSLTKQAMSPAAGIVTVQVGTLSVANDFTTFQEVGTAYTAAATTPYADIVIPASTTQKFIAFKVIGNTAHMAVAIDNVVWSEVEVVTPECEAVATLDENFNDFTFTTPGTGLPQNCWSTISTGPLVYISGVAEDNYATFYASTSANVNAYLVTPELTTLGQSYELSFDTERLVFGPPPAAGTVTIQLGTLSDNTDAATFAEFGEPIAVTGESVTHSNIAITAAEGQKYIAFRIIGDTAHNAALIDNVKWSAITVGTEDFNKTSFSIFPNPTADKNVTISHNIGAKGTVSVYTLTGALVSNSELSTGSQNLNLSSLSAGMYIVKIEAGNQTATQKLIVQ